MCMHVSFAQADLVHLQTEYCVYGNIANAKGGVPRNWTQIDLLELLAQMSSALHFIHSRGQFLYACERSFLFNTRVRRCTLSELEWLLITSAEHGYPYLSGLADCINPWVYAMHTKCRGLENWEACFSYAGYLVASIPHQCGENCRDLWQWECYSFPPAKFFGQHDVGVKFLTHNTELMYREC